MLLLFIILLFKFRSSLCFCASWFLKIFHSTWSDIPELIPSHNEGILSKHMKFKDTINYAVMDIFINTATKRNWNKTLNALPNAHVIHKIRFKMLIFFRPFQYTVNYSVNQQQAILMTPHVFSVHPQRWKCFPGVKQTKQKEQSAGIEFKNCFSSANAY